jgi:hypothetical protein
MSQMPATTAGHPASWSLGPSLMSALHHSRSIGMARLYLTFTSPSTTASELHTCTTRAKRHVAHIAFVMVGLVTTQHSWITLIITHHKTKHKGTFQPCDRKVPLYDINIAFRCTFYEVSPPLSLRTHSHGSDDHGHFVPSFLFFRRQDSIPCIIF